MNDRMMENRNSLDVFSAGSLLLHVPDLTFLQGSTGTRHSNTEAYRLPPRKYIFYGTAAYAIKCGLS